MESESGEVLSAIWKVGGPLVGVLLGRYWTRKKDRVALTLKFFEEQRSESHTKASIDLNNYLEKFPEKGDYDLEFVYASENHGSLTQYMVVEGFYASLWVCLQNKQLDKKMVLELFPRFFYYWYYRYPSWFSYQDRLDGLQDQPMRDLSEWFANNLPVKTHEALRALNQRSDASN